jgi:hypothetical protein
MHRAGVFPLRLGFRRRVRRNCVWLGLHILLWRGAELCGATLTAKVDCCTLMFSACRSLRRIDLHPANGVVLFSLLHLSIVNLFAHVYLCLSEQRSGLLKLSMIEPGFPAKALWFGVVRVWP